MQCLKLSKHSHHNLPRVVKADLLQETPIAKNSKFGRCTAINDAFFVYISSNEKIRAISRKDGSAVTPEQHNSPTTELLFKSDTDLLASCDSSGCIMVHDLSSGETITLYNSYASITYSNLRWHPQENILSALSSDKVVSLWNIDDLLSQGSLEPIDATESRCAEFGFENDLVDIYFDTFLDLFVLDVHGRVFQIVEESTVNEIELMEPLDPFTVSSIFYFEDFLIIGSLHNSKVSVFEKEDGGASRMKCVQTLEQQMNPSMPEFQISFLPNSFNSSLMFITNQGRSFIRVLHFSQVHGCFTFHEAYATSSNIIYHSVHWEGEEQDVEIFCHTAGDLKKHVFSQIIYPIHFSSLPEYNIESTTQEYLAPVPVVAPTPSPVVPIAPTDTLISDKSPSDPSIIPIESTIVQPVTLPSLEKELEAEVGLPKPEIELLTPKDIESLPPVAVTPKETPKESKSEPKQTKKEKKEDVPLLTKIERLVTSHLDKLHHKLKKEQIERENQAVEQIQASLSAFCRKQAQIIIDSKLNGTVELFAKSVQESMKEQISGERLLQTLRKELFDHFTTVLGPAVETSFRAMFQQINESFEDGVGQHFQQLQETPTATTEMQTAVDSLSVVCDTIVSEMSKGTVEEEVAEDEKETTLRLLNDGDFTGAFTAALLEEESPELLFFILSKLEGSSDWHGCVEPSLMLQIVMRVALDLRVNTEQQIEWMKDLLAHLHLTPQIAQFAVVACHQLRGSIMMQLPMVSESQQIELKQFLEFVQFKLAPRPPTAHNAIQHQHQHPFPIQHQHPNLQPHSQIPPQPQQQHHLSMTAFPPLSRPQQSAPPHNGQQNPFPQQNQIGNGQQNIPSTNNGPASEVPEQLQHLFNQQGLPPIVPVSHRPSHPQMHGFGISQNQPQHPGMHISMHPPQSPHMRQSLPQGMMGLPNNTSNQ